MLTNITPHHLRCMGGACPAVYKLSDNSIIVIGEDIVSGDIAEELKGKVAPHERAVKLSVDFFKHVQGFNASGKEE